MAERLFHYTVGAYINKIVADGVIELESEQFASKEKHGRAVWCTFSQSWEKTCNKSLYNKSGQRRDLNMEETHKYCKGLYRIQVKQDSAPHGWEEWKKEANVSSKLASGLKNIAEKRGSNVDLWRASLIPIPKNKWVTIESWNKKKSIWTKDTILNWAIQ